MIKFPQDFKKIPHLILKDVIRYGYYEGTELRISVLDFGGVYDYWDFKTGRRESAMDIELIQEIISEEINNDKGKN